VPGCGLISSIGEAASRGRLRPLFLVQPFVQAADVEPESDEVPDREETVPVRKDSQGIVATGKQHVRVKNYGSIEMEDKQPVGDLVPQILEGYAVGEYDESHTGIPSDDDDEPIDLRGHLFDRKVIDEPKDVDDGPTDVWQQGDTSKGLVVERIHWELHSTGSMCSASRRRCLNLIEPAARARTIHPGTISALEFSGGTGSIPLLERLEALSDHLQLHLRQAEIGFGIAHVSLRLA